MQLNFLQIYNTNSTQLQTQNSFFDSKIDRQCSHGRVDTFALWIIEKRELARGHVYIAYKGYE